MIKLKLMQGMYIAGHGDAFFFKYDEDGKKVSGEGWGGLVHAAQAVDENGNEYKILWKMITDYDSDIICGWDSPVQVLDEQYRNVTNKVKLEF